MELMVTGLERNLTVNVRKECCDKSSYYQVCLSLGGGNVSVLPFLDLGNSGRTLTGVDDGTTPAISLPSSLNFGNSTETTAYVS